MSLVLTSGPALEPVTLAEAKAHLRVDHNHEDSLIQSLIITSRLHIEAALGLALITQSWAYFLDRWPKAPRITDHDSPLIFDDTTFEAATGFTASEIRSSVGLSVDDLEVESALVSDRLSETALSAGDFDEARIEIFRVNWQIPDQRVLMRCGSLGEVRRTGSAFAAEVRGLAHYLQQPKGRLFQYGCDADVGDARCGIDLGAPQHLGVATVLAHDGGRMLSLAGLAGFAAGWFTRGLLAVVSGDASGRASEIKRHTLDGSAAAIEIWQPLGATLAAGDPVRLTVGCDKHFATCRAKFGNAANYRGFPHMPGNDFLIATPQPGETATSPIAP